MTKPGKPDPQPCQFSLRKLLLWTFVFALGCGALAPLEPEPLLWLFILGWAAIVFILRWALGSQWAAAISVIAGMLFFGWITCLALPSAVQRYSHVEATLLGAFMGGIIGLLPFLLIEGTSRLVDRLDNIGQSNG